jgi:hypothetical protein
MAHRGHCVTVVPLRSSVAIPAFCPCAVCRRAPGTEVQDGDHRSRRSHGTPSESDGRTSPGSSDCYTEQNKREQWRYRCHRRPVHALRPERCTGGGVVHRKPNYAVLPSGGVPVGANARATSKSRERGGCGRELHRDYGGARVGSRRYCRRSGHRHACAAKRDGHKWRCRQCGGKCCRAQHQLQLLNNALAALGLNSTDIQKIDSIAGVIGDFQPTRFANLAFELQALAQQSAPQAVPQAFPPAAPQGTPQAPPPAGTTPAGTAAANVPGSTAASPGSATEPGRP